MKFLSQDLQKLEHEQGRHTDTQANTHQTDHTKHSRTVNIFYATCTLAC